jgi:hypothetical protein
LVQKPQPLLPIGKLSLAFSFSTSFSFRFYFRFPASPHQRWTARLLPRLQHCRQSGYRGRFKQGPQRNFHSQRTAHLGDQPHAAQRVPSQFEKIIFRPHLLEPQHIRPDAA